MGCIKSKEVSLDTEPDQPAWDGHVRSIRPWKLEPALTTAQLTRLRNEFWETRVEGRKEMWEALRFAAEAETVCLQIPFLSLPCCVVFLDDVF